MSELLQDPTGILWLDDHAYSAQLLADGAPGMLSVSEYVAFRRQAAALLTSDVVHLPLDRLCEAWLGDHPQTVAAMRAKKRVTAPLRAMLADEPLREHLVAVTRALRQAFAATPLVIAVPSPANWIGLARDRVDLEAATPGQPEVDGASVYVADFLRTFGECDIDGVLLIEDPSAPPHSPDAIAWYGPVFNVAGHFRWKTGVLFPGDAAFLDLPENVDFLIAGSPVKGVRTAVVQPSSVWLDDTPPAATPDKFCYAEIPHDAAPERVLEVIADLRRQLAL